jgi:hypothetical protein
MNTTLTRSCVSTFALLMIAVAPLEAQIGGIGRRVRQAVEREAAKPDEAAKPGVKYNEYVLEMTPEVVDRFASAMVAEETDRAAVAQIAAGMKTPEAYQSCMMEAMMSDEGQRVLEEMTAKGEAYSKNPSDKAAEQAYRKAQDAMTKFMTDTCGVDPDTFTNRELPELQKRPAQAGMEAGGFTATQYAFLKERVPPLCAIASTSPEGEVRIPGDGKNIFWVYSEVEVQTIVPRCAELTRLLAATK